MYIKINKEVGLYLGELATTTHDRSDYHLVYDMSYQVHLWIGQEGARGEGRVGQR